jgi:hypothetical protein
MGCDGGTIPKRDELVRQKKKAEVVDKNVANMAKWRHCALKHDTLQRPIVVDSHGHLYNKASILEYLLDRNQFECGPTYVKKMKDVKELQLTDNPAFKANHSDLGNEYLDVYASPYICPMTGLEMNGKYKFSVLWTCGCVLSDRALRSINGSSNNSQHDQLSCPKCGSEYSKNDDVVILNPEDDDLVLMQQRCERLATNGKTKRKASPIEDETSNGKKSKAGQPSHYKWHDDFTLYLEAKVSTAPSSSSVTTTSSKVVNSTAAAQSTSNRKSASNIQHDQSKSQVYKSLFTTSDAAKAKEKNKAHWVTYNPLYF